MLANRVVVSPMCQYSAEDGTPDDWHLVHLGSRAVGGAGLVMTEMTDVSREARITPGCAGMYKPEHVAAWQRIVDFVHGTSGAEIGLQLAHAGRKGSTRRLWEGIDEPLRRRATGRSSRRRRCRTSPHSQVPREMDRADMDAVRDDFVRAAADGASEAGFDLLELHIAHGYLLASLPLAAHQPPHRRLRRLARAAGCASRSRSSTRCARRGPPHEPMSVRISATDWADGGLEPAEAVEVARALRAARLRHRRRLGRADRAGSASRPTAGSSRRRSAIASATRRTSPR